MLALVIVLLTHIIIIIDPDYSDSSLDNNSYKHKADKSAKDGKSGKGKHGKVGKGDKPDKGKHDKNVKKDKDYKQSQSYKDIKDYEELRLRNHQLISDKIKDKMFIGRFRSLSLDQLGNIMSPDKDMFEDLEYEYDNITALTLIPALFKLIRAAGHIDSDENESVDKRSFARLLLDEVWPHTKLLKDKGFNLVGYKHWRCFTIDMVLSIEAIARE